jgi:hypothetical protein
MVYYRAPWLERLTGIQFVWITEPQQLTLPGLSFWVVVDTTTGSRQYVRVDKE